ncbi:CMRF35-like molecule 1 isoform 2-T2 [Glossophaga mutica]
MHLLLLFPLLFRLSGSSAVVTCPEARGSPQGSLTVKCRYDPGWESHVKYWCRGADLRSCKTLVRAPESQWGKKKSSVSIRDDRTRRVFTVTMEKLRRQDADTYWCGIERSGSDRGVPVKVTVGPGSSADVTGPEEVTGPEQGSLTVQCCYDPGWEPYVKYWCRGADWNKCQILVRTTGSELEVREDRVSIRDNHTSHTFTVTMEKLRREDADTYWCGIEKAGSDPGVRVKVAVGPATTTVSTTTPITTTFTVPVTTEVPTSSPNVSSLHPEGRGVFRELNVLLPLLCALLLLLLGAALLLVWRVVKRRKKAAGVPPEQVLQPLEGDVCYANLTLQQFGSTPSSTRKRASAKHPSSALEGQAEVEYNTVVCPWWGCCGPRRRTCRCPLFEGFLSEGGHFLCSAVSGRLESGRNLRQRR